MTSVPLLGHASLDDVFAWRPAGTVRVRDFLAEVAALTEQLPAGNNLLNICQDRYRFTVGFAAGLISGKTSLQPASQSAETLRQIQAACPDVVCLCDDDFDTLDLPRLDFPVNAAVNPEKVANPAHSCRTNRRLPVSLRLHRPADAAHQNLGPSGQKRPGRSQSPWPLRPNTQYRRHRASPAQLRL